MTGVNFLLVLVSTWCLASCTSVRRPKFDVVECYAGTDYIYPYPGSTTIIRSHNYGKSNYENNEQCAVRFETQEQPLLIKLQFTDFDLENSYYGCSWDAVCINGYEYCGRTLKGSTLQYSVPAFSSFTYSFRTDSSVTNPGYEVYVDAEIDESPSEDGDYQDRCPIGEVEPSPTPSTDPFWWNWNYTDTYSTAVYDNNFTDYSYTTGEDNYSYTTGEDNYSYTTGEDNYSYTTGEDNYSSPDYGYTTSGYGYNYDNNSTDYGYPEW